MKPENVTKGRIAETLVNELLRKAGFHVYRFGYESVLQNLTQVEGSILKGDTDITRQIRSIPDFLCVKEGKPIFVEVKFKSRWLSELNKNFEEDRDIIKQLNRINQFWKATVIFVTTEEPYFRVLYPPYYDNDGKLIFKSLIEDKSFSITSEMLLEFNILVEKYLKKAKQKVERNN